MRIATQVLVCDGCGEEIPEGDEFESSGDGVFHPGCGGERPPADEHDDRDPESPIESLDFDKHDFESDPDWGP